jgi:hypothetical protein
MIQKEVIDMATIPTVKVLAPLCHPVTAAEKEKDDRGHS